jgi:hypothetical protein
LLPPPRARRACAVAMPPRRSYLEANHPEGD